MSDSIVNKRAIVANAIAITAALSIISGYSPINRFSLVHMQSFMPRIQTGQLLP